MSSAANTEPWCSLSPGNPAIRRIVDARPRDADGLPLRRLLPAAEQPLVGPFIFFDHMGPVTFAAGQGMDVRPHPHIGLATVTYLFEGEVTHRDSLGTHRAVRAGEVGWMTAGRGIVHSERTGPEARASGSRLHGIQAWVALPRAHEEAEPEFLHHARDQLPATRLAAEHAGGEVELRLVLGSGYGLTSPARHFSPMFYVDASLPGGAKLKLPEDYAERAAYVVSGTVHCGTEVAQAGRMLVFEPEAEACLVARESSRVMLLGGAPMDGERYIFWNFVSSSRQRLEQAKVDWKAGRFPKIPGDEIEFIPLPD